MIKRLTAAAVLTGLQMGLASHSEAADRGFYFGAELGGSRYDSNLGDQLNFAADFAFSDAGGFVTQSEFSRSDTGFSVLAGYQILPYLAVEAAYIDLGEANFTATGFVPVPFSDAPLTLNVDRRMRGGTVAALGILPLSPQWELFGRAGVFFADTEIDVSASDDVGILSTQRESDETVEALLGVGAAFTPVENWTFKVEYRVLSDGAENEDDDDATEFFNLGVTYRL